MIPQVFVFIFFNNLLAEVRTHKKKGVNNHRIERLNSQINIFDPSSLMTLVEPKGKEHKSSS